MNKNRTQKIKEVSKWIDTEVIGELLWESLEMADTPLSVKNAKELWLEAIEKLGAFLDETALGRN